MTSEADDRWTVGRLLTWTRDFLKKKGSESPRLDAEVLLAAVLDCERVRLYTRYDEEVGERERSRFRELVKRRAEGSPVAYLVGRKEFYSMTLAVSPAVLIPRPDTEFVVVEVLARIKILDKPRCVDVGTGSGCIALACLDQHKSANFVAIDLSPEALAVARSNAEKHGLSSRIKFLEGDLLEPVEGENPFDMIVSNPPYIASATIAMLDPGVANYEPHLALDGGLDGLRVVARLIESAVPLIKIGGHLVLEIGSDQEAPVRALIAARPAFELSPTVRDSGNHPRVIIARKKAENAR